MKAPIYSRVCLCGNASTPMLTAASMRMKKQLSETQPKVATRKASEMALEVLNPAVPETLGGSADLTGSNNTKTADLGIFSPENRKGRYVHYGIREHGMAAAMNGMALHGGIRPYGGTFMCFTDYARPAMRLAALMKVPTVFVMTHDSIGLGEDGPTHQPVEQTATLRMIPPVFLNDIYTRRNKYHFIRLRAEHEQNHKPSQDDKYLDF